MTSGSLFMAEKRQNKWLPPMERKGCAADILGNRVNHMIDI